MADGILLASRFLIGRVATGAAGRDEKEALPRLLSALVRTPTFAALADVLARDFDKIPPLAPLALKVCETALAGAQALSERQFFPLWSRALLLNAPPPQDPDEEPMHWPGPAWLQSASRLACQRGPALAAYLSSLDNPARVRLVDAMVWGQPPEITANLIDAVWNDASAEVRRVLAAQLDEVILDAEDSTMERMTANPWSIDQARLERIIAAQDSADPDLPFLAADGLQMWRRLGLRALPFNARLLPFAMFAAGDPSRYFEVAKAYVADRPEIDAWLEILEEASCSDSPAVALFCLEVVRHIGERYSDDRPALARGLLWLGRSRASLHLGYALAQAFERADLATPDVPRTPDEKLAARIARRLLGTRAKAARKTQTPRKPKKPPRRRAKVSEQLELPMDEEKP